MSSSLINSFKISEQSAFKWVFLRQEMRYTECYANWGKAWWSQGQIRMLPCKYYVYCHVKLVTLSNWRRWFQTHFCNRFLQAIYASVFYPKLKKFSLMKFGCTWVGISVLRLAGIGAVLIQDRVFKYPFTIRRVVCGVRLLLHE